MINFEHLYDIVKISRNLKNLVPDLLDCRLNWEISLTKLTRTDNRL